MEVSRSRFYDYFNSLEGPDDPGKVALKARIVAIFKGHRGKYGSRRIVRQLKDEGRQIGRHKVRRLMRELDWMCLAVVLDLYSRQIAGWAMNKRMKKQLTLWTP